MMIRLSVTHGTDKKAGAWQLLPVTLAPAGEHVSVDCGEGRRGTLEIRLEQCPP